MVLTPQGTQEVEEHKHGEGISFDQYVKRFLQLANKIEMTEEEIDSAMD
jgi:hypothetical protein